MRRHQSGYFVVLYHDDWTAVDLVLHRSSIYISTTSVRRRLRRLSPAVLVAVCTVVVVGAGVGAAVKVDGRVVGQEPERLEPERHQRVVDRVERQRRLDRAPKYSTKKVKEIIVLIKARSFLDELNLEHLTS